MKKSFFLIIPFFILYLSSCDPGYFIAIRNATAYDKPISMSIYQDSVRFSDIVPNNEFKVGKYKSGILLQHADSMRVRYNRDTMGFPSKTVTIPAGEMAIIQSGIIGWIRNPKVFIDGDSVKFSDFSEKRRLGGLLGRSYIYNIE